MKIFRMADILALCATIFGFYQGKVEMVSCLETHRHQQEQTLSLMGLTAPSAAVNCNLVS